MPHDLVAAFRAAGAEGRPAELSLTRRFRHPPEKVWAALVTPERLEAWLGAEWLGKRGPLREGGPFDYRFANTEMASRGRVLRLEPPRLLEHSWFENIPPGAVVRWEVEPEGAGSRLTLTQRFLQPDDAARNAAGWTELLRRLEAELDGGDFGAWSPGDWRALRDEYADRLGEEAVRDGRVVQADGGQALRFVRILRQPPEAVWAVLTNPGATPRWMQADVQLEPRPGGVFELKFHSLDFAFQGRVEAYEPPSRFAFAWPDDSGGESVVDISLEPHPFGCRLTLTEAGLKRGDLVDHAGGWHWHLDALERALKDETVAPNKARVGALEAVYKATLLESEG
ncbi:MAG TPA: SRPBCC family protein [Caulobacteraceae bacterium]